MEEETSEEERETSSAPKTTTTKKGVMGERQGDTMEELTAKIESASAKYEAEKKVVEALGQEAQKRTAEVARLKALKGEEEERHLHEASCAEEVGQAKIKAMEYEVRMFESEVSRLRMQRDAAVRLEQENASLQKELADITQERNALSQRHALETHEAQKELLETRRKLEDSFRETLDRRIRRQYQNAFEALPGRDKDALLKNAQLKEEQLVQEMGIAALEARNDLDKDKADAYNRDAIRQNKEQSLCAATSATVKRQEKTQHFLKDKLEAAFIQAESKRKDVLDDSFASLSRALCTRSDVFSDFDQGSDALNDAEKQGAIKKGLKQLERRVRELKAQVDKAESKKLDWRLRFDVCKNFITESRHISNQLTSSLDDTPSLRAVDLVERIATALSSSEGGRRNSSSRFRPDDASNFDDDDDDISFHQRLDQSARRIRQALKAWDPDFNFHPAVSSSSAAAAVPVSTRTASSSSTTGPAPGQSLIEPLSPLRTRTPVKSGPSVVSLASAATVAVAREEVSTRWSAPSSPELGSASLPKLASSCGLLASTDTPLGLRKQSTVSTLRGSATTKKKGPVHKHPGFELPRGTPLAVENAQRRALEAIARLETHLSLAQPATVS